MDIAEQQPQPDSTTDQIKALLRKFGASPSSSLPPLIPISDQVKSQMSILKLLRIVRRVDATFSADTRNVLLVVAVLIATATYQAALSPPGGVWQDDSTSPETFVRPHVAGKAIMSAEKLQVFVFSSTAAFVVSIVVIIILLPRSLLFGMLSVSLFYLTCSYVTSIEVISPAMSSLHESELSLLLILLPAFMVLVFVSKYVRSLTRYLGRFRRVTEPHSQSSIP